MTISTPALSEDARVELTGAAAARERFNRPRALVILAGLALAGAGVYLAWAVGARASAAEERDVQRDRLAQLRVEADKILALDAKNKAEQARLGVNPNVQSQLEQFALVSGMPKRPLIQTTPDTSPLTPGGPIRTTYSVTLDDQSAEAIFGWLARSAEIEGLTVTQLNLAPDLQIEAGLPEGIARWKGTVQFTRYEKR